MANRRAGHAFSPPMESGEHFSSRKAKAPRENESYEYIKPVKNQWPVVVREVVTPVIEDKLKRLPVSTAPRQRKGN
jgi:hypothetical protein